MFETLGVEFAANFDDYLESQDIDDLEIREIAALKARELYRLTGLPAIAERTGFKVEPTKRGAADIESGGTAQGKAAGYQFNSVGAQAEKLVAQLSMFGDEERYCSYTTVVCAFDGENTIYEQAEAQVSSGASLGTLALSLALRPQPRRSHLTNSTSHLSPPTSLPTSHLDPSDR